MKTYFFEQLYKLFREANNTYSNKEITFIKLYNQIAKKVNLHKCDNYYFPIIIDCHWSLIHVDNKKFIINYYDSLLSINTNSDNILSSVFIKFFNNFNNELTSTTRIKWKFLIQNVPQQNNYYDCGVFMCKYLEYLLKDEKIDFSSEDMPYFRLLIGINLLKGRL
jgi:sentrin-specific protease 1